MKQTLTKIKTMIIIQSPNWTLFSTKHLFSREIYGGHFSLCFDDLFRSFVFRGLCALLCFYDQAHDGADKSDVDHLGVAGYHHTHRNVFRTHPERTNHRGGAGSMDGCGSGAVVWKARLDAQR